MAAPGERRPAAGPAALCNQCAIDGCSVGDVDLGGDGVGAVLDADRDVLTESRHPGVKLERVALHKRWSTGDDRIHALRSSVIEWQDVVTDRFDQPKLLEVGQPFRLFA